MATEPHVHTYKLPTGRSYLGLVVKRAYRIPPRGRAEPLDETSPLQLKPSYADAKDAPGMRRLVHDSDLFAAPKQVTDVLLNGSAHSRRGHVLSLDTALEIGPVKKAVRVHGDRRIERAPSGELCFGPAEGFIDMPITWDLAYGGRDLYAEQTLFPKPTGKLDPHAGKDEVHGALSYPRNYAGRGFFISLGDTDRERFVGTLAPNLEDPNYPIAPEDLVLADLMAWIDGPVSACYGPIDYFTFPRALFVLRPDFNPPKRRPYEVEVGAIHLDDLEEPAQFGPSKDPRAYSCAPAGLGSHRLAGGEKVKLWNLHRGRDYVEFDLPEDRPTLVLEPPGVAPRTLEPQLATVLIEPDDDKVTLTWAGALETAMVYPEEMLPRVGRSAHWTR